MEQTKRRSRWPARRTLAALGIPARSYYRWLREEAWAKQRTAPVRLVQCYEALQEEKAAVRAFACRHTELRHRELAWRMIDEEVAYLSPSTVYRILRESNLVCPWRRRSKRGRRIITGESRRSCTQRGGRSWRSASSPPGEELEVTTTNPAPGRRTPRPLIPKRFVPLRMKHFRDKRTGVPNPGRPTSDPRPEYQ